MAYNGTTSTAPNPPELMVRGMGGPLAANSTSIGAGRGLWFYQSTADDSTVWMGAGYFTDGKQLGMRTGDVLMGNAATTQSSTGHKLVIGVLTSTNSTAGWNLSTGGSVTSTYS